MIQTSISRFAMSVYVNGTSLSNLPLVIPADVFDLYWFDGTNGFTDNTDGTRTQITEFPAWAQACVDVFNAAMNPPAPPVTPPTAEENKQTASDLLYSTDWTSIPHIADPNLSNPYLDNQVEFFNYRTQLRELAVNPCAGFITWPEKPKAQWTQNTAPSVVTGSKSLIDQG